VNLRLKIEANLGIACKPNVSYANAQYKTHRSLNLKVHVNKQIQPFHIGKGVNDHLKTTPSPSPWNNLTKGSW